MEYKSVKGFSGWGQLGFLFAFLGAGFVLAGIVQLIMLPKGVSLTSGADTDTIMKTLLAPENVGLLRASQAAGSLLMLFVPAYVWSVVSNGKNMFWLGFNKYFTGMQLFIGFLLIFSASIAAGPLEDLTKAITVHFPSIDAAAKKMEDMYNAQVAAMTNLKNWGEYLMAIVIMAFLPAVFEEVFFRGALQNLFIKWWKAPLLGIFISSLIFSLIHASIYLFLSRLLLGFVLGLMYYKTKNIWVNILAHFLNNAIAVSIMFFSPSTSTDPHVHWTIGVGAVIALTALFYYLDKISQRKVAQIDAKENLLIAAADPFRSFTNAENN
jgi:membrane protease YdiL (CAAX protease family)